jgi:hypothetical protein
MHHPFTKLFTTALKKSTLEDNRVLEEAEHIRAKGYDAREIYDVLEKLRKSLLSDTEASIVQEAAEHVERHIDR